jgi:quercetin dioxygenase-like cupin family protein
MKMDNASKCRLHKFDGSFSWSEVEKQKYKDTGGFFCGIDRNTLVGNRGEDAKFELRYFEIGPGGNSSLEKHVHEHAVVCVRGRGKAIVGAQALDLNFMDVVYIAPDVPHQLVNTGDEPFGFLCIVDSERDRPRELDPEDIERLKESEETKNIFKA